jgi:hypothetical protein
MQHLPGPDAMTATCTHLEQIDWWWCYPDDLVFDLAGAPPAPSHP